MHISVSPTQSCQSLPSVFATCVCPASRPGCTPSLLVPVVCAAALPHLAQNKLDMRLQMCEMLQESLPPTQNATAAPDLESGWQWRHVCPRWSDAALQSRPMRWPCVKRCAPFFFFFLLSLEFFLSARFLTEVGANPNIQKMEHLNLSHLP